MINTIVGAGAVGAGAASRYGSGSDQKRRLLAAPAPAPQHWMRLKFLLSPHTVMNPLLKLRIASITKMRGSRIMIFLILQHYSLRIHFTKID
jgi:hypothetical protein